MSTPRRSSPIERFLGPLGGAAGPAGAGPWPFALLGLTAEECTDEQIITALERQIQRIEAHPEGDTPEADEVRLALHAAAAQLLDSAVRQQLIFRWREGGAAGPASMVPPTAGTASERARLEHDAILTMAQHGGWNQESLRKLALLASARGLPANAVKETLSHLSKRGPAAGGAREAAASTQVSTPPRPAAPVGPPARPAPAPAPMAAGAGERPREEEETESSGNREMWIVAGVMGVGAVALAVLLGILIVVTSRPVPPAQQQQQQQAGVGAAPAQQPAPPAPVASAPLPQQQTPPAPSRQGTAEPASPAAQRFSDVHEAIRALRAAAERAKAEPDDAAATFADAAAWIGGWWCRLEVGQLRAANDAAVEFIYAIANWPDAAASAVDAVAAGAAPLAAEGGGMSASDVWPAAWSAGMLVRLSRERDLPADLASRIDRALVQALGADRPRGDASFEGGAAAALARMPLRIIAGAAERPGRPGPSQRQSQADPDSVEPALRRWAEAIAAAVDDQLAQERLLVDGLEQILVAAPEPDASRRVFEAVQVLATEIRWRRGGPARARLVEWFRDGRVSSGDLHVLTTAMATGSAAEGVGPRMVLAWGAQTHDREKLRGEYAAAWGIAEAAGRDRVSQAWADAVVAALARSSRQASPTAEIAHAAELAMLHQAARHLWRGESTAAEGLVQQSGRAAERAQTSLATGSGGRGPSVLRPGSAADGEWARHFVVAGQNRQLRLERLTELERAGGLGGPADAEVLVEAACFATPMEVRAAAQRVVTRYARDPLIVNAMLEFLPKAPRVESISTMVEVIGGTKLPRPSDPDWMLIARRGLVERLAEVLAGGIQGYGAFDRVAGVLRGAYGFQAPAAGAAGAGWEGEPAAPELGDLWRAWRAEAETFVPNPHAPMPLEKVVGRRAGRTALAVGPVQAWAAEQASLAELLAYTVAGESPSRAPYVGEVIAEMAELRREATHVFEQIRISERAMLRLWLLRLGREDAWSAG